MKLCLNCRRTTPGKPTFCNFCGSSFNVRLCPSKHINPRSAEACSQCGSRELSQAQPKPRLLLRPLLFLLSLSPGLFLIAALIAFVMAFVRKLFSDPSGLLPLMCLGLLLCVLFGIWIMLPNFLKEFIKRIPPHSSKGRHRSRH
jgi:RNA polymerase subunit RPABC4/transcription elongation factor Spt4